MPIKTPPLTDVRCRGAKPVAGRNLKLFDGGGLFLEVKESGSKLWRLKYRHLGREKLLALGVYPGVGLSEARELNEQRQWSSDAIEEQLSHKDGSIRGIYNNAKYLNERREMMQAWADYLEALKR
ncbi:MAG TPA: integrase family protein [Lysobacter sp.]